MATFLMFGSYTPQAMKEMSAERTGKANDLVKKHGGTITSMYATLGKQDVLIIADFPGAEQAMKASVALTKMTNIGFSTSPAVSIEQFDKMIADV